MSPIKKDVFYKPFCGVGPLSLFTALQMDFFVLMMPGGLEWMMMQYDGMKDETLTGCQWSLGVGSSERWTEMYIKGDVCWIVFEILI